ncbi:MAG: endonuclease/exonuclease/phosphatase family protein [Leptospirillia bacterium]
MFARVELLIRRVRKLLSRSEWAVRLLRLPVETEAAALPGLVMLQIDGLSHAELMRAIEDGEMPFLKKLLTGGRHRLHLHYSGLPSTTPAVQGELFYGVKQAVPAFSFRDKTGHIVRMFDRAPAARLEAELASRGRPLLQGGSAYVDIYTGGAAESHFCPSALGWGDVLRTANPFTLGFLVLSNAYSFVRTALLLVLELLLAVVDFVRGLIDGRDLIKELKFVPTRVGICILLRELTTIGVKMDVTRGLPVVHANFIGYDEQAHRRGPGSAFAHWALKGIDDAVARIWRAAHRSGRRDYDVWVYSDHGQEELVPYPKRFKKSVRQAVNEVFERHTTVSGSGDGGGVNGIGSQRIGLFGMGRMFRWMQPGRDETPVGDGGPAVAAMGPLGMVYHPDGADPERRALLARALVIEAHIPMVLVANGPGAATAHLSEGDFELPAQAAEILGAEHPFLAEVTDDLVSLCHHPDAGEFVICGWSLHGERFDFPMENGSHGGPGANETAAFALLPDDTPLASLDRGYLRPGDLRAAALRVLETPVIRAPEAEAREPETERGTVRIMTYNVHGCVGMDGKHAPERIARVIARHAPDVVALQELDEGRPRSGGMDQAHRIAALLEMTYHFHPAMHLEEGRYGNAVLTHLPMFPVRADRLPGLDDRPGLEPRGAIWTGIDWDGTAFQLINTHLGLRARERQVQVKALLGEEWLGHPHCESPVILCGDFNALPESRVCMALGRHLHDVQVVAEGHRPHRTLPGRYPMARIDHVFVDPRIEVTNVTVPSTDLERVASDHLPLIVDVRLPRKAATGQDNGPKDKAAARHAGTPG